MALPKLKAIQVEISTACTLKCTFCPNTHLPEDATLMPLRLFERITPLLPHTEWVYLQGWGEPLMHPLIWDMVSLLKQHQCRVGFTTNASLLDERSADLIVSSGVDHISISIAGDSTCHEALRGGSRLPSLQNAVRLMLRLRGRKKAPFVSLSYMLTRESIEALPQAVAAAAELGVDELYLTHLDYVYDYAADNSRVFSWGSPVAAKTKEFMRQAEAVARQKNLRYRHCSLTAVEQPVCELDPRHFLFLTVDGSITPCAYLARQTNPRIFKGETRVLPRKTFGNIGDSEWLRIWRDSGYSQFRSLFEQRDMACNRALQMLVDSDPSFTALHDVETLWEQALRQNTPPPECLSCTKLFGF